MEYLNIWFEPSIKRSGVGSWSSGEIKRGYRQKIESV